MDTDKQEYRNLHSRLFASIRGRKSSDRLPMSGDIGYVKTVASAKTAHVIIPLAKLNAQFLERGVFTASTRCHR